MSTVGLLCIGLGVFLAVVALVIVGSAWLFLSPYDSRRFAVVAYLWDITTGYSRKAPDIKDKEAP